MHFLSHQQQQQTSYGASILAKKQQSGEEEAAATQQISKPVRTQSAKKKQQQGGASHRGSKPVRTQSAKPAKKKHPSRPPLTIDSHLEEIGQWLREKEAVCIVAPTGTGKSLGIPRYVAEELGLRIIVAVPTIVAALSLYRHQTKFTNVSVGYAADSVVNYNTRTAITYCTTGHLKEALLRDSLNFDVIMIDEAHDTSVDTYLTISLVQYLRLKKASRSFKLIVSSATIEATYILQQIPDIHLLDLTPPSPFHVNIVYNSCDYTLFRSFNELARDVTTILCEYHKSRPLDETFLVFCPGSNEVEIVIAAAWKKNELADTVVLPAYSILSEEELQAVFDPVEQGFRKIVVATNIVESSCTIENVGLVVDTMMEKVIVTSETGAEELKLRWCSKTSSIQRKGRTGRMRNGTVVRMCTEEKFESLDEFGDQEISRAPISRPLLSIARASLSPFDLLVDVEEEKINAGINELMELALLEEGNDGARVWATTEAGRFCERLPLGVRLAAALERAVYLDCAVSETIAAVAVIEASQGCFFYMPRKEKGVTDSERKKEVEALREKWAPFKKDNDVATLIAIIVEATKLNRFRRRDWAKELSLNLRKINEALKLTNRICSILGGREVYWDLLDVKRCLINLYPFFFTFRIYGTSRKYKMYSNDNIWRLSSTRSFCTITAPPKGTHIVPLIQAISSVSEFHSTFQFGCIFLETPEMAALIEDMDSEEDDDSNEESELD